ncbi:MAG TPA: hypothetical protein VFS20_15945 [Longimicrobium sp.]|nr:hypothetical protein [Longimicrobium sp.]
MHRSLHALAAIAAVVTLAACGAKTEGGDPNTEDPNNNAPAATPATATVPAAGDSAAAGGTTPYVVQNGEAVTPASGQAGPMAPGDTAFGNAGPAGPSGPGGQDTLVTKPRS